MKNAASRHNPANSIFGSLRVGVLLLSILRIDVSPRIADTIAIIAMPAHSAAWIGSIMSHLAASNFARLLCTVAVICVHDLQDPDLCGEENMCVGCVDAQNCQ